MEYWAWAPENPRNQKSVITQIVFDIRPAVGPDETGAMTAFLEREARRDSPINGSITIFLINLSTYILAGTHRGKCK
jgi:hypothetical protein